MLRLRKVLLSKIFYTIVLLIISIVTFFRIVYPYQSRIHKQSKNIVGIIEDYQIEGDRLSLLLKTESEKLKANYYFETKNIKNKFLKEISLGDKLQLTGTLEQAKENTTPGLFNYQNYLKRNQIYYLMKIEKIVKIDQNKNIIYTLRNITYEQIKKSKTSNAYLKTFLLGDMSSLNTDVMKSFSSNGITHLFAISGMHIILISSVIMCLLKKIKLSENKQLFFTTITLIFYLLLTGLMPSILRAVVFFILNTINKIYYFYIKSTFIFLLTLAICLLINPFYIYDIGFLYSFTISFFLILTTNILEKYKNYIVKLFITSFISFFASLPITMQCFNQINILSILYNLFYVPFINIIIFPLSLIQFVIPWFDSILSVLILFLEKSSLFFDKIPIGKIIFCRIPLYGYFLYYLLLFGIILTKKKKIFTIIFSLCFIMHYLLPRFYTDTSIIMLDIGQGDSFILRSKNKTVLIDTGGIVSFYNKGWKKKSEYFLVNNITIPYLKKLGISKIDKLILTHGDSDHMKEATTLIKNFQVEEVYINENRLNYLEQELIAFYPKAKTLKRDDSFTIGDLEFYSLGTNLEDENDSSIVLFIKYKNYKILMMGDASIKSEENILRHYELEEVDILKLGHHGSKTSTGENFLKKTNPKLALISAGKDNKFKHPSTEVMIRLKKHQIPYLLTSETGTVSINLTKQIIK